jgi:hypothetical protein
MMRSALSTATKGAPESSFPALSGTDLMPTEGEVGAVNIARRMAAALEAYRQFSRTVLDAPPGQLSRCLP